MAAMGLAGVGGLALKALGVSMAALMLAGIVALKKVNLDIDIIKDTTFVTYRETHNFVLQHLVTTLGRFRKHFVQKNHPRLLQMLECLLALRPMCSHPHTQLLQQLTEGGGDGGHSVHYVRRFVYLCH